MAAFKDLKEMCEFDYSTILTERGRLDNCGSISIRLVAARPQVGYSALPVARIAYKAL